MSFEILQKKLCIFTTAQYKQSGLEFIDILNDILSVQQEKSGMQMNQLCTINISNCLQCPIYALKACNQW